ncbi:MAG: response regulator transcription factor [Bradyrhizobiaceae bacterium]|nr:response regulator transcription factor [Bradyrhizobiaceae bacterium]
MLAGHRVDMMLIDTHALRPGKQGVQDIIALRTNFPRVTIVVLVGDETIFLGEVLESIAHGAISKDDHPQALLDLCTWVRNGCYGFWISPTVADRYLRRRITAHTLQFTDQERRVLQLLDLTNKEIATDLRLTVGTVKNYVSVIYDKLGVHSRAEALKIRG